MLLLVTKKALLAKTNRFSSDLLPFTSLGGRVSSLSLPLREVLTQRCCLEGSLMWENLLRGTKSI